MHDQDQSQARESRDNLVRRELERESHNIWRVYNPLQHDFHYMWDSRWHKVPAKGTKDIEQFLTLHYFKKIAEYMIGKQMMETGEKLLARRREQGLPDFLDKYEENKMVWDKTPKLNDPDLLREIRDLIVVGLVEEYGLDIPDTIVEQPKSDATHALTDDLFFEMGRKRIPKLDDSAKLEVPIKKKL